VVTEWSQRSPGQVAQEFESFVTEPCTVAGPAFVFYAATELGCEFRFYRMSMAIPNLEIRQREYREAMGQWRPSMVVLEGGDTVAEYFPADVAADYVEVGRMGLDLQHRRGPLAVIDWIVGVGQPYQATVYLRQ